MLNLFPTGGKFIVGADRPANVDERPLNELRFFEFRVMVYRMGFLTTDTLPGVDVLPSEVGGLDFSQLRYDEATDKLNTVLFQDFLREFYSIVKTKYGYSGPDGPLDLSKITDNSEGIFRQFDITPLVKGYSTHLGLEDPNTCNIDSLDPRFVNFGLTEIERYLQMYKSTVDLNAGDPLTRMNATEYIDRLKSFRFQEFDLVRVFEYSSKDMSHSDKARQLSDANIPTRFAIPPAFTGIISSINRSCVADQVPIVKVSCVGMMRLFMQSVCTFNDSLANVLRDSDPNQAFLANKMAVTGNVYQLKSADTVFGQIVKDYLKPKEIKDSGLQFESDDLVEVGPKQVVPTLVAMVPDVMGLLDKTEFAVRNEDGVLDLTNALIPFFPSLILYHTLKTLYREPIAVYDDRVEFVEEWSSSIKGNSALVPSSTVKDRASLTTSMSAYLDMIRQGYDLYDSTYTAPADIFQSIRDETFFEIFEDRTGMFHFRFPRYNSMSIIRLREENVVSVSYTKDDSANYNAVVSSLSFPWIGAVTEYPGAVNIDRFSIFRHGFRMPQVVQNKNATNTKFMAVLSTFLRSYKASKAARKATVVQFPDPFVSPGDMVSFRIGPFNKSADQDSSSVDPESEFVGYVVSVDESVTADGMASQSLSLDFVRPSGSPISGKKNTAYGGVCSFTMGRMAHGSELSRTAMPSVEANGIYIGTPYAAGWNDISSWMIPANVVSVNFQSASFKSVLHPIMLAKAAAATGDDNDKFRDAFKGESTPDSISSIDKRLLSINSLKEDAKNNLAMVNVYSTFFEKLAALVLREKRDINLTQDIDGKSVGVKASVEDSVKAIRKAVSLIPGPQDLNPSFKTLTYWLQVSPKMIYQVGVEFRSFVDSANKATTERYSLDGSGSAVIGQKIIITFDADVGGRTEKNLKGRVIRRSSVFDVGRVIDIVSDYANFGRPGEQSKSIFIQKFKKYFVSSTPHTVFTSDHAKDALNVMSIMVYSLKSVEDKLKMAGKDATDLNELVKYEKELISKKNELLSAKKAGAPGGRPTSETMVPRSADPNPPSTGLPHG